jgi:arsenite-transporting ATPase
MLSELVTPKKKGETRFIFFSGKGGVGKSTMSCATAVWLAEKGYSTLLVTTDPAPNLSDIFGQEIGPKVTPIKGVESLRSIEIDPDVASEEYRGRILDPMRQLLDEKSLQVVKEQLNSPCLEEVAAFDKFIEFMDDPKYDVVIFDTAPTGHTIRLLELPSGWSDTLQKNASTCMGPSASLQSSKAKYEKAISYLQNPEKTLFVFVLKPESMSIYETKRSLAELVKLGIETHSLIVNGVLPKEACTDDFFMKKRKEQEASLARIEEEFKGVEKNYYPLRDSEVLGVSLLESVGKRLFEGDDEEPETNLALENVRISTPKLNDPETLMGLLTPSKHSTRYIFFTGKGGVGKSTVASATSLHLAEKGYKTLIVTTDPASHLQLIFDQRIDHEVTKINRVENLYAARIDQRKALDEYKKRILEAVKDFPEETKKSVLEDLNSPCAEEMSSFEKFMSYFDLKGYEIIIFDTAPTGHTLRLLELPSDWKGFIDLGTLTKNTSEGTYNKYSGVIESMRDRGSSTFVFVMYPEYTPMIEAWRAAEDLRKQVGIETALVAINYLLPPEYGKNEFFGNRRVQQEKYVSAISDRFNVPMMAVPLFEREPKGLEDLRSFGKMIYGNSILTVTEMKRR